MSETPLNEIVELDRKYTPFPSFEKWKNLTVDVDRWNYSFDRLQRHKTDDPKELSRAREVAKRTAAVDTGAIEGLYETSRGFTISVATQFEVWKAQSETENLERSRLIEAQLVGYDEVIDLATKGAPMAAAWIRSLHATICSAQKTYRVMTEQGPQEHALPLGSYKVHPNHVGLEDGSTHSYAPVIQVETEVARLIEEITGSEFESAHPAIQAAFAHYACVSVHPFADGNGRVARALASVFFYRTSWVPYMVLMEHKDEYFRVLQQADKGDFQGFVDFSYRRGLDAFSLVYQSFRASKYKPPLEGGKTVKGLHVTRGGYSHAAVDRAGEGIINRMKSSFEEFQNEFNDGSVDIDVSWGQNTGNFPNDSTQSHRKPADLNLRLLLVRFISAAPAAAQVSANISFIVPLDAAPEDEIVVRSHGSVDEKTYFNMSSVVDGVSTIAELNLKMFVETVLGAGMEQLRIKSENALKSAGLK